MSELEFKIRRAPHEATVLELRGRFDKAGLAALEDTLRRLEAEGRVRLLISCRDLGFLSSEAAGMFLSHLVRIRAAGGDIRFSEVSGAVRTTLVNLGLVKLLVIFESEQAALAGFDDREASAAEPKPTHALTFKRREDPAGVTILWPCGAVDRHTIEQLDTELMDILAGGCAMLVVDGSELDYISSNGMGVFIGFLGKFNGLGGDLRFCGLKDIVRTVVTTLGLHRLFRLFETQAEAVASFAE